MSKPLSILFALVLLAMAAKGQSTNPVRLALIAPEAALRPALDLLTVELSRDEKIILLERAEIERVLREQSISATSPDYVKLGQVLGADGLLLAEMVKEGDGETLAMRLVAVRPGVMLGSLRSPWPVTDVAQWVKGVPNHFAPLLPKLNVLAKDAVPISVVNLRAAVASREMRELEQHLTLLAIERLTRERELFVLERRRMDLLSAEKELKAAENSDFWNGSYLLDGVIDRDGYSRERVTLHVRLTPPRAAEPMQIEISGPRTNLAAVVDQLAARILAALRLPPPGQPWNALAEAEKYFAEARWAYQWGMLAEAAAASEAGWALGGQTTEVAALRVRAYYENGIDRAQGNYDLGRKLVTFSPGGRPVPGEFVQPYDPPLGCGVPPDHTRFDRVRRAMSLYGQGFQQFIATNSNPGWDWHDLGIDLLEGASYWLRHYYYLPEGRMGVEAQIAEVQLLAREIASLIEAHPAYTNDYGRKRYFTARENWGWGFAPGIRVERDRATLWATKAIWGAYWFATPESGLGLYREIVERGQMPNVRRYFLNPDFCEISAGTIRGGTLPGRRVLCYLTGWKGPDRQRALALWRGFVEELCASTHLNTQAEGLFLRCAHAPTDAQHAQYFRELLAFMEAHQEPLAGDGFSSGLAGDLDALIAARRTGETAVDAVLEERQQLARRLQQAIADAKVRSAKSVVLKEMKDYLAAGEFDFMKFNKLFFQFDYSREDAQSLLPAVEASQSNLTVRAEAVAKERDELQRGLINASAEQRARHFELVRQGSGHGSYRTSLNRLESVLKLKLNPPPPNTSNPPVNLAHGVAPATPGRSPRPEPIARGFPSAASLPTNVLAVTRFWSLLERSAETNQPTQLAIANWCYREGRLWVDARAMRLGTYAGQETFFNRAVIFSIEPDTLTTEVIPLDSRQFTPPERRLFEASARGFEVHNGWLYVSSADVIRRFSLKTRAWEDLPVPLQGHARITFVGDRMILTTKDSVLAASPNGEAMQILASNRRQPPVTRLDSLSSYDLAPVVPGPDGSLILLVADKLYELPANGKDWNLLPSALITPDTPPLLFAAGLAWSQRSPQGEQAFALRNGARAPELLRSRAMTDLRGSGVPFGNARIAGAGPLVPGRMPFIGGSDPRTEAVCLEQDMFWVLSGAFGIARGSPVAGRTDGLEATLLCYERGAVEPVPIPIRLQMPEAPAQQGRFGGSPGGIAQLESTPTALAVSLPQIPGIWLIPKAELAKRRTLQPPARSSATQEGNAP